jgi:hypothetical protein
MTSKQSKHVVALLVAGSLLLSAVQVGCAAEAPQPDMQSAAQVAPQPAAATAQVAQQSPDELNQLVAPIALYPDALVAQIVAAASYPTEVVEAERWMQQHSDLKGQALAQAVDPQPWDPSVKALTQFPTVLTTMDKNLSWTSSLGEAYVNQQQNVLDAVQVMRRRAQQAGNLKSTTQETVTDQGQTIGIEPADPELVYVPEYNPWTIYGDPVAFYPGWVGVPGAFYYGPGIAFGLGIGIGLFGDFGWGWHHWGADWHRHDLMYDHHHYLSHSPTFGHPGIDHGGFDHGGFDHAGIGHGGFDHGGIDHAGVGHAGFDRGGIDHAGVGHAGIDHGGGIDHAGIGHAGFDRGGIDHAGVGHAGIDHGGIGHAGVAGGAPLGTHTGAFSGFNHGGITGAYSSRGQASFHGGGGGGLHGGGGGFHGGGGGGSHGGGGGGSHGGGGGGHR